MENASNGVSSYTSFFTSALLVNRDGYCFLVMSRMAERRAPIRNEVTTTTTTENFAVLGCPAPSSFDTLTLWILKYKTTILVRCAFMERSKNKKKRKKEKNPVLLICC